MLTYMLLLLRDLFSVAVPIVKRSLPLIVFIYNITEDGTFTVDDLSNIQKVTASIFSDMYSFFFAMHPEALFQSVEITNNKDLGFDAVKYNVDVYFYDQGQVPDVSQIQEVAVEMFAQGAHYLDVYLKAVAMFGTGPFVTTESVTLISDDPTLQAYLREAQANLDSTSGDNGNATSAQEAKEQGQSGDVGAGNSSSTSLKNSDSSTNIISGPSDSNVAKIVSPVVVGTALILVFVLFAVHRNKSNSAPTFRKDQNLMKHKDDDDVESATYSRCTYNTYRTGAFSDEGVSHYTKQKAAQDRILDDLDEVSLGSSSTATRASGENRNRSVAKEEADDVIVSIGASPISADAFYGTKKKTMLYDDNLKPEWAARSSAVASSSRHDEYTENMDTTTKPEWALRSVLKKEPSSPVPLHAVKKSATSTLKVVQKLKQETDSKVAHDDPSLATNKPSDTSSCKSMKVPPPEKKFISASPRLVQSEQEIDDVEMSSKKNGVPESSEFAKIVSSQSLVLPNSPMSDSDSESNAPDTECCTVLDRSDSINGNLALPELNEVAENVGLAPKEVSDGKLTSSYTSHEPKSVSDDDGDSTLMVDNSSFAHAVKDQLEGSDVEDKEDDSSKPAWLKMKPTCAAPDSALQNTPIPSPVVDYTLDNRPAWTKAELRKSTGRSNATTTVSKVEQSPEPEWMIKFKQMGLDKESK
jgi:hypothetical protein